MQAQDNPQELAVTLTISEVNKDYLLIDSSLKLPQQMMPLLVHQTYFFFIIELRTGIKVEDLPKISNYFIGLCDDIISQDLKGISFVINGQHHVVENRSIAAIKELFEKTFVISQEDDYSKTLVKTRHSIQSVAQKLNQTKITLLFFFSHIEIDHTLGVKKRSYIDHLNQHAELCRAQVAHLGKNIRRFTDQCKTYIISYDKHGEEETDYSLCDTDLMNQINMNVGKFGSTISRNYSYNQLNQSFENTSALMLFKMYSVNLLLPVYENKKTYDKFYQKIQMECEKCKDINGGPIYMKKWLLDGQKLKQKGVTILKDFYKVEETQDDFHKKLDTVHVKTTIIYDDLPPWKVLFSRTQVGSIEVNDICTTIQKEIVSYKRRYEGGKSYLQMNFNKELFLDMRDQLQTQYEQSKDIFEAIREGKFKGKQQMLLYDSYNQFKGKIDRTRQVLVKILKQQIGGSQIGQLSQVINLSSIKTSLKNKLMKRINANPFLLDQVYNKVEEIVDRGGIDFPQLQVDTSQIRKALGNCIVSDKNLVKAMCQYDALGVAFEIQRPMAAIADPGRIRIRQVSPSLMSVSTFFQKFLYKIQYTPNIVKLIFQKCGKCKSKYCSYFGSCDFINKHLSTVEVNYNGELRKMHGIDKWNENPSKNDFRTDKIDLQETLEFKTKELDYLREAGELQKYNYQERCDYTDRVDRTPTALGFMPLYLAKDHWRVAKQLMKPCLAFTATGEPLAYMYAQYQNIPFMMLSSVIRTCKELEYQLEQQLKKVQECSDLQELHMLETALNLRKSRIERMKHLRDAIEITCRNIMEELSRQHIEQPLVKLVQQRFRDYKEPINRTVDVIGNNSAFLGQLFTAFNGKFLEKPKQEEFNWMFVRLIEEELRRETDGWNEEQTQDAFVDKLLNLDAEKIKKKQNQIVVVNTEDYLQRFLSAMKGVTVQEEQVRVQRQQLEMMLTKQGKFNDNQRMLLIEYKRLYENRVLWMWYVRFLLYGEIQRKEIHKWKCLGLLNSYMLFTMIIQNKKQRKNYKRREAINQGQYADPFDYYSAREYLQGLFSTLYNKIIAGMCKNVQYMKAKGAAEVFALTHSLEEAAGVLLNTHNLIPDIFQALLHNNVPLFVEKMEMLVHGTFRGVHFEKWIPGKRRERKLRMVYRVQYMRYQSRM